MKKFTIGHFLWSGFALKNCATDKSKYKWNERKKNGKEKKDLQKQHQRVILSSSSSTTTTITTIKECNKPIEWFGNYLRISKKRINLIVAHFTYWISVFTRVCVIVCAEVYFIFVSLLILQWQSSRKVAKKNNSIDKNQLEAHTHTHIYTSIPNIHHHHHRIQIKIPRS